MAVHKEEMVIVKLAKMLANKQLESNLIQNAFSLLCEEFDFDTVLMYEMDWRHDFLHLTETYFSQKQRQRAPEFLLPNLCEKFTKEPMVYCDGHSQLTPEQKKLLSLFGAQSAAIAFLFDENDIVYSLFALCRTVKKKDLDEFLIELGKFFKSIPLLKESPLQFKE